MCAAAILHSQKSKIGEVFCFVRQENVLHAIRQRKTFVCNTDSESRRLKLGETQSFCFSLKERDWRSLIDEASITSSRDVKKDSGKKIVEAMCDNTAPERFREVKNDGENTPKHKNGDHIRPRQCVQQNPARQVNAQKQQR
jgi:hypothetical protein